jgi:hypothetical protein
MAGRHRSATQHGGRSALKSAVWLLQLLGFGLALLAVLGLGAFGIYLAVTSHWQAYSAAVAFQAATCLLLYFDLGSKVLRNRPRSPAAVTSVAGKVATLVISTCTLLVFIGRWQGWANGSVRWVLLGINTVVLAYVLVGERFFRRYLEARAAAGPHPS